VRSFSHSSLENPDRPTGRRGIAPAGRGSVKATGGSKRSRVRTLRSVCGSRLPRVAFLAHASGWYLDECLRTRLAHPTGQGPRSRFLMLRGSRFRPEGAVTNQPRATPWDHVDHPTSEPCKGETKPGFHRRLQHRDIRELCRPYRACGSLESEFPGRCPGLSCRCPCGTKDENSATSKLAPRVGIWTNAFVRDWLIQTGKDLAHAF
jgi:hypothetical protein